MLGQLLKEERERPAQPAQPASTHPLQRLIKEFHPGLPAHLSERAKLILSDYNTSLSAWSETSLRKEIVERAMTPDVCEDAHNIVVQGFGDLDGMRNHAQEREDNEHVVNPESYPHPPPYFDQLQQLALLVDFAYDLHESHKATPKFMLKVSIYDRVIGSVTTEVLKHLLRKFDVKVEAKNPSASEVVGSRTLWYTPGCDQEACPEGWNGGHAPIMFTNMIGQGRVRRTEALAQVLQSEYKTLVQPRDPIPSAPPHTNSAFKRHGLYARKMEGVASSSKGAAKS